METEHVTVSLTGLENVHAPRKNQTKRVKVELELLAPSDALLADIEAFIYDLEWVGGCRDPENDPMSDSVFVVRCKVRRLR